VIDFTTTECLLFPELFAKPAMLKLDQRQGSSDGGASTSVALALSHAILPKRLFLESEWSLSDRNYMRRHMRNLNVAIDGFAKT
jgi:hypothetical protein